MAEEEKPKRSMVKTTSIAAAGMASVAAALFTSKLGVAGTLIGTAMTSMVITLTSAILNAQLERASTKISGLPSTVRGRLSTQQVRIPGRPSAEPNPEPANETEPASSPEAPASEPKRRDHRRSSGFLERLRSIPTRLREMSPATRRRVLVSGALAGVVSTVIALSAITATEVVAGENFSSLVWSEGSTSTVGGTPGPSRPSILGGTPSTGNQQYAPSGGLQPVPGGAQQYQEPSPSGAQQYQEPSPSGGQPQQDEAPVQEPAQEPIQEPVEEPVPGAEEQPAAPSGQ